ncbi:flagellar biosynthetic protein FliO [Vicingaceae bacterium]|nr:flagellar biosynthetic protein FliO [Vicingaceae bacterium]
MPHNSVPDKRQTMPFKFYWLITAVLISGSSLSLPMATGQNQPGVDAASYADSGQTVNGLLEPKSPLTPVMEQESVDAAGDLESELENLELSDDSDADASKLKIDESIGKIPSEGSLPPMQPLDPLDKVLTPPDQKNSTNSIFEFSNPDWMKSPAVTAVGSLAIVFSLFFVLTWIARRSGRGGSTRLPGDVMEVLGIASLNSKHKMQLVRLGSKLVLLSVSPNGVEPISEITDPIEVDQIIMLCRQGGAARIGSAFRRFVRGSERNEYRGRRRGSDRVGQTVFEA